MSSHTLPPLPYAYDALEPYISQEIMVLHHTKHHQTYVNALNAAEASYARASTPKERIALQAALKFNGGGLSKSILFFQMLIAVDQDTSTTPCSGRILHLQLLKMETEAFFPTDPLKLPSRTLLEVLKISRKSLTRPPLESKDLDGAGLYVSFHSSFISTFTYLFFSGFQPYDQGS